MVPPDSGLGDGVGVEADPTAGERRALFPQARAGPSWRGSLSPRATASFLSLGSCGEKVRPLAELLKGEVGHSCLWKT